MMTSIRAALVASMFATLGVTACSGGGGTPVDPQATERPGPGDDGAPGSSGSGGSSGLSGSSGSSGSSEDTGSSGSSEDAGSSGSSGDAGSSGSSGDAGSSGSTGDAGTVPTTNDPFDSASCPGTEGLALASKFAPGASVAVLGSYTLIIEKRSCTTATGCGAWTASAKSAGPSGSGKAELVVQSSGVIDLVLVDNDCSSAYGTPKEKLGHTCSVTTPDVTCPGSTYYATNITEGAWPMKVGGKPGDKFSGSGLGQLEGDIRPTCLRLTSEPVKVGTAVYDEYRSGILVRY